MDEINKLIKEISKKTGENDAINTSLKQDKLELSEEIVVLKRQLKENSEKLKEYEDRFNKMKEAVKGELND